MNKIKNKLVGYVSNNEFNEKIIPIPFQNIILRNYCKDNDFTYVLPYNETIFKNSFSQLITLINKLDNKTAIIACSIYMLPKKLKDLEKILYLLKKKEAYMYFIYENLYLKNINDIKNINLQYKITKLNKEFFTDINFKKYYKNLSHKS